MEAPELKLALSFSEADADAERIDDLTRLLQTDLYELGVDSVERPAGEPPPEGAKGEPFTLGALALVALPAVLPSLVAFLQAWTLRSENRKVKIKTPAGLEVEFTSEKGMSEAELLALVDKLSEAPSAGRP